MLPLAERIYFLLSLTLGRLLRGSTYATTRIVDRAGVRQVRKRRRFHAPLLVWLGVPLTRLLGTGVCVLSQRAWQQRERQLYLDLTGASIQVLTNGTLILPYLPGRTLAALLADPQLDDAARRKAIELGVVALAELHQLGITHGDAMAENVMIDLSHNVAHWFDFETVHVHGRTAAWRRADDVRALLATCLLRTAPAQRAQTLNLMLDVYADESVAGWLATWFGSVWQRPLTFHLGQAPLSHADYAQVARWLGERRDLLSP